MRFKMIRSGFGAIAVSIALVACGGHSMVPSQSFTQNTSLAPANVLAPDVSPDKSPCDIPGLYYFHGSCATFKLSMTANTTVPLGSKTPYKGLKVSTEFEAVKGQVFENPPKGVKSVPAVLGDATGNGDITGKVNGKSFPLYGVGKDCVTSQGKAEVCPGKPFVYAQLVNQSKYTLKPKLTPKFVISDANGFPGKKLCFPAILTPPGPHTVGGWAPNTTLGAQPHGTSLTINAQPNPGQLVYPPGPFDVVGACE